MIDPTTRQRRADATNDSATRGALLRAARECVGSHGLTRATSRMIAEAAGANLAAITYYFGSKDQLIADALFDELASRLSPVLDQLAADTPAPARLLAGVQGLVAEFEQSPADVPIYLNALLASTEPGPLADRAHKLLSEVATRLAHVIGQLNSDGVIAQWVDAEAMAAMLIATANGMALQTRLIPDGPSVADMAGQVAGLLLAASNG